MAQVDLDSLRKHEIVPYDTSLYPFLRCCVRALAPIPLPEAVADDGNQAFARALEALSGGSDGKRGGNRGASTPWIKRWNQRNRTADVSAAHDEFDRLYISFLREIVLPQIGDSQGILFQRDPTFRCHVAHSAPSGRPHSDSEYGHQLTEINYWLPLTRVCGSNSLYCESAPGVGDFEPFEGEFGLAHRFWGAACHHYTVANETEATRVSFDFRVVPLSCHAHNASRFELGGFYGWLTADGDVRMTAVPAAPHARVLACVRTGATASGQTELQDGDASNREVCNDDDGLDACELAPISLEALLPDELLLFSLDQLDEDGAGWAACESVNRRWCSIVRAHRTVVQIYLRPWSPEHTLVHGLLAALRSQVCDLPQSPSISLFACI